jgi:uncharacterized membrane protein
MIELAKNRAGIYFVLWLLLVVYAASRVLQVFPGRIPMLAVVVLHVIPPAVFALIHGSMFYRLRTMLIFFGICLVIGNIFENLGASTGFPYGPYYFTNLMGPKLFVVPVFLGLAYVGMAYLSWMLARLILGETECPLVGSRVVTVPLIAGVIMVAWDFCMDPIWSTILHAWIWRRGGAYFGVPVSNFVGWYIAVYVIYQLFAFYIRNRSDRLRNRSHAPGLMPSGYWRLAILFYAVSAAGNLLLVIPRAGFAAVSDATGTQWKVSDITGATALSSIFTMGAFALAAWLGLDGESTKEDRLSGTPLPEITS